MNQGLGKKKRQGRDRSHCSKGGSGSGSVDGSCLAAAILLLAMHDFGSSNLSHILGAVVPPAPLAALEDRLLIDTFSSERTCLCLLQEEWRLRAVW